MSFAPYALVASIRSAIAQEVLETQAKLGKGAWLADPHGAGAKLVGRIAGLERAADLVTAEYQKLETLEEVDE